MEHMETTQSSREQPSSGKSPRVRIAILFFTLVVVMLGFGMIIPILPFYVEAFGGGGKEMGALMAVFALMQFVFAPVWGQLSDRHGRKVILMVGVLGNAISMLLFGLSTSMWMLIGSRALAGILSSATLPTAMAYIGDSTSEEDRGGGMGMMGAAMGVGMVLGPGLGGWLASDSLSTPFFVAAGLSLVALVLVMLVLPESLPQEARTQQVGGVGSSQPRNLGQVLLGLVRFGLDLLRDLWQALFSPVGFLLVLSFLVSFGLTNFESVFGLYAKDRYDYSPGQVGTILTVIGLISALTQGLLTGPLTRRWGELAIIRLSLLGSVVGFVLMLLPDTFAGVVLSVSFFILSNAMIRPAVSSLISKRATGGQGVAMGLNNSFMSLGRVAGPMWAGAAYDLNLTYPYMSGAAVMLAGLVMSLFWQGQESAAKEGPVGEAEPAS